MNVELPVGFVMSVLLGIRLCGMCRSMCVRIIVRPVRQAAQIADTISRAVTTELVIRAALDTLCMRASATQTFAPQT